MGSDKEEIHPGPVGDYSLDIYIGQQPCVYVLTRNSLFSAFSKPFVLTVVTDNTELRPINADIANRGFCLNYEQLPC